MYKFKRAKALLGRCDAPLFPCGFALVDDALAAHYDLAVGLGLLAVGGPNYSPSLSVGISRTDGWMD